jgi:hypothetical protein
VAYRPQFMPYDRDTFWHRQPAVPAIRPSGLQLSRELFGSDMLDRAVHPSRPRASGSVSRSHTPGS